MAKKIPCTDADYDAVLQFRLGTKVRDELRSDPQRRAEALTGLANERESLLRDIGGIRHMIDTVEELAPPVRAQYRRLAKSIERVVGTLDSIGGRSARVRPFV